jgi:4-hydroxybenzoate polyprenyltransferase
VGADAHEDRAARWAAFIDLSRARQALLSIAQPALGALLALGEVPSTRVIALGLLAAGTGYLAVFSLNDVLDRRADTEALATAPRRPQGFDLDVVAVRHPLARGDLSLGASVVWTAGLAIVSATCAWILSPLCLALFGIAVALEILYCLLRSVTWTKTIVSGCMVGVGGLAGWAAVAPLSVRATPFFAVLALWEIAARNLPNDLADLDIDMPTGIRTVATVFGAQTSARAILLVTAATLLALAALPVPVVPAVLAVVAGLWAMALPAAVLARDPTPQAAASFFNRASLLPALVLAVVLATALVGR